MTTFKQKIGSFQNNISFDEIEFKPKNYVPAADSTEIEASISFSAIKKRLNDCFDIDGWNFEINNQLTFDFPTKKEYAISGVLSVKGEEGEWVNKSAFIKIDSLESLDSITENLISKCAELLNVGGALLERLPKILVLGHINNLAQEHLNELLIVYNEASKGYIYPNPVQLGTGQEIKSSPTVSKSLELDKKQKEFIIDLAGKQNAVQEVENLISTGEINKSNFTESVVKFGYTGESIQDYIQDVMEVETSNELTEEQKHRIENAAKRLDDLGMEGVHSDVMYSISQGDINLTNFDAMITMYENKLQSVEQDHNNNELQR